MTQRSTTTIYRTAEMLTSERAAAVAAGVEALGRGLLTIIPTETVYGLAASAASREGLERLTRSTAATRPEGTTAAPAWHAHSAEFVRQVVGFESPLHRRLLSKLAPGPVTFVVEKPTDELERIRTELGAVEGSLHTGRELAVRIPSHSLAREVLAAAWEKRLPVVAEGIAAARLGRATTIEADVAQAIEAGTHPASEAIGIVFDDGPTRLGKPSTVIRLRADGDFNVVSEGVLEERYIRKQLDRNLLFVCTGNTCRSPMAEAIAAHALSQPGTDRHGIRTHVRSAGVSAYGGEPVSREAVEAVQALGIDSSEIARHMSRELTRQMIADSDIIFTMTAGHARAVAAIDPSAASKVVVLDPGGEDIPDPIGGPQDLYTRTAQRLSELIHQRLAELDRA